MLSWNRNPLHTKWRPHKKKKATVPDQY